jgi:hypothetical protein
MKTKFVWLVAVASLIVPLFGAARADATTPTSTTALSQGEVLVDDAGGQVFVTATDTVAVFDLAGDRIGTIEDQFGAKDLLLRGRTLYVLAANVNRINTVDADTLAVTGGWNMPGVSGGYQMAWAAGALWVTYDTGTVKLDPTTGAVTLRVGGGGWVDIEGTTNPPRLYIMGDGTPSPITAYDISSGLPIAMATTPWGNDCENGQEPALAPSGNSLWTACGAPYVFKQWDRTALATGSTATYPGDPYPDAVAVSGDGRLLVAGSNSSSEPDIRVYDVDRPSALKVLELGYNDHLLRGMLAPTKTGDRVYAVSQNRGLVTYDFRPAITEQPAPEPAETETDISLVGTQLSEVTSVKVGDTSAAFTVGSDQLLHVTLPELEAGTYPITVTSRWGSNEPSEVAQIELDALGPEAPPAPTVTGTPAYGVSLQWTAPDSVSPINSYRVRAYVGDATTPVAQQTVTDTSMTFGGLTAETGYRFTVAAVNDEGVGWYSARSDVAAAGLPDITPFDSLTALINRQYRDLLGRAPTTAERTLWLAGLRSGDVTPVEVVVALRDSADNRANVDAVDRLYLAYFGRPANTSGLAYWTAKRRGGTSLSSVSDTFATSSEFRWTYASLSNRAFVQLVYQRVLGRPGDAGGVHYWTSQIDLGRKTRGTVMVGFSESTEYVRSSGSEVSASVLPTLLLGHAPTRADYESTVDDLDAGTTTDEDIVASILASPEYAERIATLS